MNKRALLTALLLSSLTINGHAYGAERVVVDETTSASIISQTISDITTVDSSGGAMLVKGAIAAATASITNSTYTNNASGSWGGAAYVTNGTLNIKGSTFDGNIAAAGGALAGGTNNSNIIIDSTNFTSNKADWVGALGVFKNAKITNSKFTANEATNATKEGGGAMFVGSVGAVAVLDNVTFTGNKSASVGGAIATRVGENANGTHNDNSAAILNITNSTFDGNSAATTGGAIDNHFYNENNGITNTTFKNNYAANGGAIYNHGDVDNHGNAANLVVTGGSFKGNSASVSGGAIYTESDAVINGVTFDGNKIESDSAYSGGAIFVDAIDKTVNVTNSTFTNNKALNTVSYDSDGSAISVKNGTVNIIGSTFENNVADQGTINQYASRGGQRVSIINIDGSIFKNNEAKSVGGVGIFNVGNIKNTEFIGNKATDANNDGGGAMFVGSEGAVAILDNVTFTGNTSASSGGAIGTRVGENANGSHNDNSAAILNITNSTFEGNKAATTGGAIDYHFYNENGGISNSTFINNSANAGGAIYNHGDVDNKGNAANLNITGGLFSGNTANNGGAIYNAANATINGVEFNSNSSTGSGGALYTAGKSSAALTEVINSTFSNNNSGSWGGAAYVTNGTLDIKGSTFANNTAEFAGAVAGGTNNSNIVVDSSEFTGNSAKAIGALGVFKNATITNTVFKNNSATDSADDGAGALFLGSEANAILDNVVFEGNTSAGVGGAIATRTSAQGDNSALELTITNSTFTNNTAAKEGGAIYAAADMIIADTSFINNSASKGGAIYTEGNLTITAQSKDVVFDGNTSANLEDGCDIYMATKDSKLAFNTSNGKTITINGGISGTEEGYNLVVNETTGFALRSSGSGSGGLNINSYVKNANLIDVTDATLTLGANADVSDVDSISITNGGLDTANGVSDSFAAGQVSLQGNVDVVADVSLGGQEGSGDNLRSAIEGSTANVSITGINAVGDTTASNVTIDVKKALGLEGLSNVTVDTANFVANDTLTPVRWLKGSIDQNGVVAYNPRGNKFGDFNPAVMAGPVAAQLGGFLNQINSYNQAFMNMDMKMLMTREERQAMRMRNSYAATSTPQVFSPTYLPEKEKAGWVRPYASFEKVGLDGGPRINNVMYGSFFGADSDMYQLKNGAEAQVSVYAGYTGSHQTFSGNSIYQNGGTLGLTGIVYKDNFFTALTANTGASVADMSTMYGSEDMPMLMAGVASKTGYNWELAKGKFIVQPSYLMSYTFVNAFDYTNAAGVRMESDPLNAIQIAPGVKFIGNFKNGWQPYVNLRMVWNLMGKSDFTAANTSLPELSVKPYFEYGVGLQKRWGERFTGFGQAMLRAGGRTGVGLGFGFRWALGKAPSKAYNPSEAKNIIQPTSVKLSNIK